MKYGFWVAFFDKYNIGMSQYKLMYAGTDQNSGGYPWPADEDPNGRNVTRFDTEHDAKRHCCLKGMGVEYVTVTVTVSDKEMVS